LFAKRILFAFCSAKTEVFFLVTALEKYTMRPSSKSKASPHKALQGCW